MRDKEEYVWISTADGVNRYDGYRFKKSKDAPFAFQEREMIAGERLPAESKDIDGIYTDIIS